MQIQWMLKRFDELTPYQLYAILQLRNEVFVVEQNCVFQDADDKDQKCYHLMGFNDNKNDNKLVAYTRIAPPRLIYEQPSIGRVITSPSVRRKGVGIMLMQQSIGTVYDLFGKKDIKIGAQQYLKDFYGSFGFEPVSDIYLEDGIPHLYMLKKGDS